MSIPGKVLIALLCALIVSVIASLFHPDSNLLALLLPSAASALLAVLLSHRALPMPTALADSAAAPGHDAPGAGPRESGTVKWFNGSKGFGFIIRESGEEIFVHHRSIAGEGRRNLRDGASVSFRVVTTDKGPQAEDVEPMD